MLVLSKLVMRELCNDFVLRTGCNRVLVVNFQYHRPLQAVRSAKFPFNFIYLRGKDWVIQRIPGAIHRAGGLLDYLLKFAFTYKLQLTVNV